MRLEIRQRGVRVTEELRTHLKKQLGLGRFARRIGRVRAYLRGASGPRGGPGGKCRIVVELPPRRRVVVTGVDADIRAAITQTAGRVRRAVTRHLQRRRTDRRPVSRSA